MSATRLIPSLGATGSALAALGPEELIDLFAAEGVATKTEPGGKVFPHTDRAADVLAAPVVVCRASGRGVARLTACTISAPAGHTRPGRTVMAKGGLAASAASVWPASRASNSIGSGVVTATWKNG